MPTNVNDTFRAMVVRDPDAAPRIETLDVSALPPGDVLVDVQYSTLNYKDGLAIRHPRKVMRRYPMVPGIDLAGTVLESGAGGFAPGDAVVDGMWSW